MTLLLLQRVGWLWVFILFGFLAGRFCRVDSKPIASLIIYFLAPALIFSGAVRGPLPGGVFLLGVLVFSVCCALCLLAYGLTGRAFASPARNILAFASGSMNCGYFGLPVVLAVLGPEALGTAVVAIFGYLLYENTLGFFITARGTHTVRRSIGKVLRLPATYAFVAGLILSRLGVRMPPGFDDAAAYVTGAYVVLGMMLIGLGISAMRSRAVDWGFLAAAGAGKFIGWPLAALGWIAADRAGLHLMPPLAHDVLWIMSWTPLAANSVALATELDAEPDKASVAVLASTALSLVLMPLAVAWKP